MKLVNVHNQGLVEVSEELGKELLETGIWKVKSTSKSASKTESKTKES